MQNEMKLIRNNLDLQLSQAVREISSLRESQTLTRQYRHDMRHHLQYVSTCIVKMVKLNRRRLIYREYVRRLRRRRSKYTVKMRQ